MDAHVVKACHWSDGGSEFVFLDGTVLSFCDHMNTFVAVQAGHPEKKDLMVTSLCLSAYEPKVRAALAVFNRFSARPRLIHRLCASVEKLWTRSSPIESLVLSRDPSLFSREWLVVAHREVANTATQSHSDTLAPSEFDPTLHGTRIDFTPSEYERPYHFTLWCAMRKICLTVHASREWFTVSWPARVQESDGSSTTFVPPFNERGEFQHSTHGLAVQRAIRYVMLEQLFFVAAAPQEWSEMLRCAFELDSAVPLTQPQEHCGGKGAPVFRLDESSPSGSTLAEREAALISPLRTPAPWGAPLVPTVPLERFAKPQRAFSGSSFVGDATVASIFGASNNIRFSAIEPADAHSFVASTHIHNCPAQVRLHAGGASLGGSDPATLVWRWDADPAGRTPAALYHAYRDATGNAECSALVLEDECVVTCSPSMHASGRVPGLGIPRFTLTLRRLLSCATMPSSLRLTDEEPNRTCGPRCASVCVETREYTQDGNFSIPLPKTINPSRAFVPVLGWLGRTLHHLAAVRDAEGDGGAVARCDGKTDARREVSEGPSTDVAVNNISIPGTAMAAAAAAASIRRQSSNPDVLDHGRYFPMVAESLVSILSSRGPATDAGVRPHDAAIAFGGNHNTVVAEGGRPTVVGLACRLDGVGSFTAMTNGVIRTVFDDRVIVTLIPDEYNTEEGLVCEVRDRNGEVRVLRVAQVLPSTQPLYDYLHRFMLPFRNYSRLSPQDRENLSTVPVSAPSADVRWSSLAAPKVSFNSLSSTTAADISCRQHNHRPVQLAHSNLSDASVAELRSSSLRSHASAAEHQRLDEFYASQASVAPSSLDLVVMNASSSLELSRQLREQSAALLQHLSA